MDDQADKAARFPDLRDTIARLQAYQEAGADVLYAPVLDQPEDLRELIASVDLPVNVLARQGAPSVAELTALGVKRVSVGGGFAFAAFGAVLSAATGQRGSGCSLDKAIPIHVIPNVAWVCQVTQPRSWGAPGCRRMGRVARVFRPSPFRRLNPDRCLCGSWAADALALRRNRQRMSAVPACG